MGLDKTLEGVQSEHKLIQSSPKGWRVGDKIREGPGAESPQIGNGDLEVRSSSELTVEIKVGDLPFELAGILTNMILPRDQVLIDLASLIEDAAMVGASKVKM